MDSKITGMGIILFLNRLLPDNKKITIRDKVLFSAFKRKRGFTFLEIMISLVILASCLIVLLKLQSRTIDNCSESQRITETLMLAKIKMVESESEGFPEIGKEDGDFGNAYPGYRWLREVSETGVEALRKIRVIVMPPGEESGPGAVQLETFLARVENVSLSELTGASGGATSGQESSSGSGESQSTSSSGSDESSSPSTITPGKAPPEIANAPAPQDPAAVFLPWLSPNAPRNPRPRPSGQPPQSLPWLTGGSGSGGSQ